MGDTLKITTVQTDLHWENPGANLHMLDEKIRAIQEQTHIVVLPEMFSTGFSMNPKVLAQGMDGEAVTWMKKIAAGKKIIIAGSLIIEENGQYFNRLVWIQPDGKTGHYDKRHLFGYADEDTHYTAGNKRLITSVNGWKINLLVCYDLRFPVWARQQQQEGAPEYDVLIYVANWPEKRNHAWKTLLAARAIENQCYVVGVNRVGLDGKDIQYAGDTMVIDPFGEIVYTKNGAEDIHTTTLERSVIENARNKFPFLKDADDFGIS
jgi:omega-amidase